MPKTKHTIIGAIVILGFKAAIIIALICGTIYGARHLSKVDTMTPQQTEK